MLKKALAATAIAAIAMTGTAKAGYLSEVDQELSQNKYHFDCNLSYYGKNAFTYVTVGVYLPKLAEARNTAETVAGIDDALVKSVPEKVVNNVVRSVALCQIVSADGNSVSELLQVKVEHGCSPITDRLYHQYELSRF